MRLYQQIKAAQLSPSIARTFADGLRSIAQLSGPLTSQEQSFVVNLVPQAGNSAAPFEDLWPCAELFLKACICVSLVEGNYTIEKTRQISTFAHRLGFSAQRLAQLEENTFRGLREIGTQIPIGLENQIKKRPHRQYIPEELSVSCTQGISLLSNSDAELITSTTQKIEVAELTDDNTDFWKRV